MLRPRLSVSWSWPWPLRRGAASSGRDARASTSAGAVSSWSGPPSAAASSTSWAAARPSSATRPAPRGLGVPAQARRRLLPLVPARRTTRSTSTGQDIAASIAVRPEATILTYSHAAFTVREILFAPIDEPGIVVLLDVDSVLPLTVTGAFRPRLRLMWPAGLMTPNVEWDEKAHVYFLDRGEPALRRRPRLAAGARPVGDALSGGAEGRPASASRSSFRRPRRAPASCRS